MDEAVYLFAGPSLFATGLDTSADDGITWLPPARRGDIEKLVEQQAPGVIGLADGTFHSYPSVSHVELREAMNAGWCVYGLCSMGAIRACEMQHMGLQPWGSVAAMFCEDPDFADDEVALVHGLEPPFVPLSEPLVHIRAFCAWAFQSEWLTMIQVESIVKNLRERWYGERTLTKLCEALHDTLGVTCLPSYLTAAINDFTPFRLKQADLKSFVAHRPWMGERS